jgi:CMP-N-acetylneuraminic acid synthetase
MEPRFQETGSVYITRYKNYKKTLNRVSGNIIGIEVGFEESLEVDTLEEFQVIEAYFELHKNNWSEYL